MKVLYLTLGVFDKGGIARYGRYQVSALRDMLGDDSIDVLSLMAPDDDAFESPFSVRWHGPTSKRLRRIRMVWRALRLATARPDIIWSGHVNLASLGLVLARLSGAKPVLNIYGLEVWSKKRLDAQWGLRRTPFLVSDCNFTAEFVNKEMPWSGRQTYVAWDCVDCTRFKPGNPKPNVLEKYGLDGDESRYKVLMLGRICHFSRHKGWERLVRVADKLRTSDIVFIFAGDGSFREELQELVQRFQLNGVFKFTGSIDENDLVDIYQYCDLFSLVSDRGEGRGEGLPLTPLEAAACGKAIIVGNQDGSAEAVEDGRSGFAINPFDTDRHADLILALSQDRGLSSVIGESARPRIERYFSYDKFKDQTASITKSITQTKW